LQPKIAKKSLKTPIFKTQKSIKIINVDNIEKIVTSAFYACLCLSATIFTLDKPTADK